MKRDHKHRIIRLLGLSLVPYIQLEKQAKDGCYIPIVKQSTSKDMPQLTPKEQECLRYFVDGLTVTAVAQLMGIGERRVCLILASLRQKFNVNTDHWLVARYYQLGMDTVL